MRRSAAPEPSSSGEKSSYGPAPFSRAGDPIVSFEIRTASGPAARAVRIEQAQIVLEVLQWVAAQARPGEFLRTE